MALEKHVEPASSLLTNLSAELGLTQFKLMNWVPSPSQAALNGIIKRAPDAADFPSVLEPVGLDMGVVVGGQDGMTVFLFARVRCMIWDVPALSMLSATKLPLRAPSRHHTPPTW